MSEDYNRKIKELNYKLEQLNGNNKISLLPSFLDIQNINIIYFVIPVIVFFLLILIKPNIIITKIKDKKTFLYNNKVNYLKVFLIILFLIFIEIVIYFLSKLKS